MGSGRPHTTGQAPPPAPAGRLASCPEAPPAPAHAGARSSLTREAAFVGTPSQLRASLEETQRSGTSRSELFHGAPPQQGGSLPVGSRLRPGHVET